ncbi:MAG: ROK family protein [Methanogenium sp.]|nr:ROK family protein [Methanogenium sp.]
MNTERITDKNIIAVDLGGTHTRIALISDDGVIIRKKTTLTPVKGDSGLEVTKHIIYNISDLLSSGEVDSIGCIGICSAGPVDLKSGKVVNSPNMAFPEIDLTGPVREKFCVPVALINDCRAGVLGEQKYGTGADSDNITYITISTGIGGGAIVNGTLILGRDGNAGEIGHMIVDGKYSMPCHCGGYGHWEAYASGRNIPDFFRKWAKCNKIAYDEKCINTSEKIFELYYNGDQSAQEFMDELGKINAAGISNVIIAYSPEIIVLDGPVARNHEDIIIASIRKYLDRYLKTPDIVVSSLKGDAPLLGTSLYAKNQIYNIK